MSNAVKIGDIASLKTGPFGTQFSAKEYTKSGIPVINVKNIGYGQIIEDELEFVSEQTRDRLCEHILRTGDIVFGRKGSVDRHAYISEKYDGWVQGSDCIRLRFHAGINTRYISHFLKLDHVKKQINCSSVGSTMASLNTDILRSVEVLLPSIGVQSDVEKVLSAIEEKMEVNTAICTELESMAKTIYDYWFTQFDFPGADGKPYRSSGGAMVWNEQVKRSIPTGWNVGNLYAIAEPINGLACQKHRPKEGERFLPVVKIKEMHEGITADTESVSANIPEKHKIFDGDILFSWSATLEVMYWYGGDAGLNQHIFKVVPKTGYSKELVYHQFAAYVINFVKMAEARKTTMGHITTDHLDQSRIVLPPSDVMQAFSEIVAPIHEKIGHCRKENRELTKLRDWLLPMLMNGQATVADAEDEPAKVIPFVSKNDTDQRFTTWLQNQGVAARGDIDMQTMREIFDAMDDDDK